MSHHYSGPDYGFPHGDARLDLTDLYAFRKPGDKHKSIFVMNVHPSAGVNPPGPTTDVPFATEAVYELKIDTDNDLIADVAYRVRFASGKYGAQTATLRRVEGEEAAGIGDGGEPPLPQRRAAGRGSQAEVSRTGRKGIGCGDGTRCGAHGGSGRADSGQGASWIARSRDARGSARRIYSNVGGFVRPAAGGGWGFGFVSRRVRRGQNGGPDGDRRRQPAAWHATRA